jgi:hypothetical protein
MNAKHKLKYKSKIKQNNLLPQIVYISMEKEAAYYGGKPNMVET